MDLTHNLKIKSASSVRYRFANNIVSQFCNVWLIIKTQIHMFSFYNVLMVYIAYCGHGAGFYIIVTQ